MKLSELFPHYLLKVDAAEVILSNGNNDPRVPSWVRPELRKTSVVVVRRGILQQDRIPVGIRGSERSQRWAAWCPPAAIRQVITPAQLLERLDASSYRDVSPTCRGLGYLAMAWAWFTKALWGPGGSLGFELATGARVTTPRSDLDIVIYAEAHLPRSDAQNLLSSTGSLGVPVDIRVETPICGFSLFEYVRTTAEPILLRTPAGPILGENPWGRRQTYLPDRYRRPEDDTTGSR